MKASYASNYKTYLSFSEYELKMVIKIVPGLKKKKQTRLNNKYVILSLNLSVIMINILHV